MGILEIPADEGEAKLAGGNRCRRGLHARFVTASYYNRFPIRRHGASPGPETFPMLGFLGNTLGKHSLCAG